LEFLPEHGQNGCGAGETTSKRPRINRHNFRLSDNTKRVATVIELLESLRRPTAFGVRLLDLSNPEYPAVQDLFDVVVKPVVEDEYGFKLTVVDGKQPYEYNRVDQEIFRKASQGGRRFCLSSMRDDGVPWLGLVPAVRASNLSVRQIALNMSQISFRG
jgi:hypothetical protein